MRDINLSPRLMVLKWLAASYHGPPGLDRAAVGGSTEAAVAGSAHPCTLAPLHPYTLTPLHLYTLAALQSRTLKRWPLAAVTPSAAPFYT